MRWLDFIINLKDMYLNKLWEMVTEREVCRGTVPWGCKESGITEQEKNNVCSYVTIFVNIIIIS